MTGHVDDAQQDGKDSKLQLCQFWRHPKTLRADLASNFTIGSPAHDDKQQAMTGSDINA